tara:strand:+ start:768 stop:1250 length:483 start_codon:yes stop_codon:yes gene_type:complete
MIEGWDPVGRLKQFAIDNDIDTSDPGYIEYLEALEKYYAEQNANTCTNTYGDCEVTFAYKNYDVGDHGSMIFCKPDEIISEVAEKCDVKLFGKCQTEEDCKKCIGILEKGNVKDEKRHLLTNEQIDAGYVVLCGSKPRSKFIQIRVNTDHIIGGRNQENA